MFGMCHIGHYAKMVIESCADLVDEWSTLLVVVLCSSLDYVKLNGLILLHPGGVGAVTLKMTPEGIIIVVCLDASFVASH